jgi:SAM-dependent methyltransferase
VNIDNHVARDAAHLHELVSRVRAGSPLPAERTEEIIGKHFGSLLPMVRHLRSTRGMADRRVLEIGSAFGQHLLHWGPGSEGVEIQSEPAGFTEALGIPTHRFNVEDGFAELPSESFEAIHTHNLIEHLVSPHVFLAHCFRLLAPRGLLVIGHPVVPPRIGRWAWEAFGIRGWLAVEHINFFTPATARLTLERAGFGVLEQLAPGFLRIGHAVARRATSIGPTCYSICEKLEDFAYPEKRLAEFDPSPFRDVLGVYRHMR